jgi:hypothetical protein
MSELNKDLVLLAIQRGMLDYGLAEIASAVHRRQQAAASARASRLMVGDIFRIDRISPKAFEGLRAEVVGFKGTSVEAKLLEDAGYVRNRGNYPADRTLTIPTSCVGEVLHSKLGA